MPQRLLKKKLADTSFSFATTAGRIEGCRRTTRALFDEADEARLRSLVSETPLADQKHREANKHAESMRKHRNMLQTEIERVEALQNELLDQMDSKNV